MPGKRMDLAQGDSRMVQDFILDYFLRNALWVAGLQGPPRKGSSLFYESFFGIDSLFL